MLVQGAASGTSFLSVGGSYKPSLENCVHLGQALDALLASFLHVAELQVGMFFAQVSLKVLRNQMEMPRLKLKGSFIHLWSYPFSFIPVLIGHDED